MFVLLKFIFIFFLALYLISKIGGFLLRMLFGNLAKQQRQQQYQGSRKNYKKPQDGNVSIEHMPNQKNPNTDKKFRGGDYVEYEEVK